MRTTITLDDQLLKEAKSAAAKSGTTLNKVIEDSLRESLARRRIPGQRERITLPTHKGGRLRPGVDLYDSASLLDLMDRSSASS